MLLICFGLATGLCWTGTYSGIVRAPAIRLAGTETQAKAVVADWPQENDYSTSVLVKVRLKDGGAVKALLYLDGEEAMDLRPGDRLTMTASFRMADTMAGEETAYYYAKGILLMASCEEWTVERPERVPVEYWPALVSRALKDSAARAFPDSAAPLVTALITGDKTQLPDAVYSALRRSGLAHVIEVLKDVDGISFTHFQPKDVVRHPLVQRIVEAYEAFDQRQLQPGRQQDGKGA